MYRRGYFGRPLLLLLFRLQDVASYLAQEKGTKMDWEVIRVEKQQVSPLGVLTLQPEQKDM